MHSTATVTEGFIRLTRPQLVGTLAGLLLALLLAALDQTIVGTAMPTIIAQLNGFARYPWVTTAYLLTSTIAVPVFAKLSDIFGRKWFFLGGTLVFVAASGLCGAAGQMSWLPIDGMNQLIVFRGLQGVGAGILVALTFTIIGDVFSPVERGRYQGLFAAVWGMASIFGPTLGGWLTDHISWRWAFYVNLPVGVVALVAIYLEFPDFHPRGVTRRIDWAGVVTLTLGIVPLLLALTWAPEEGWAAPRVAGSLALAVLMLAAFLWAETRAAEPLLPLGMFRNRVIWVCSVATFVLGMGMFGVIMYLPLFMQGVQGVSATRSGSLLTPMMVAAVIASVAAGQYTSRAGRYKTLAIVSAFIVALGMVMLARMDGSTTGLQVIVNMIVAGFGLGALQPVYTLAVQNAAPREQMGAATASTQFFRSIGSTMGVAVFGSVVLSLYRHGFDAGVPAGTPPAALKPFSNPLLLMQIRPQLEAAFDRYPGGARLLDTLMTNVRASLLHGLQVIFVIGAVVMCAAVAINVILPEIPLRGARPAEPEL